MLGLKLIHVSKRGGSLVYATGQPNQLWTKWCFSHLSVCEYPCSVTYLDISRRSDGHIYALCHKSPSLLVGGHWYNKEFESEFEFARDWYLKCLSSLYWDRFIPESFFLITGPFVREIQRWPVDSPHKRVSNTELWFLCAYEQTVEQSVELPVIWDDTTLIWHICNWKCRYFLKTIDRDIFP